MITTTTAEFTNIQREENPGLNAYIHNVLIPAMKQDAEEEAAAVAKKKKVKQDGKSALNEALTKSVTNEDTSTEDEDEENDGEENDYDAIEADVAEEDSNEDDDEDDDDDEDEDFDSEDDDDDDDDMDGSDNNDDGEEGYAMVVQDDFAKSLVKKKQEEGIDGSETESEDDSDAPRKSKRLRQG